MTEVLWKTVAIILAVALVAALAVVGVTGVTLYTTTVELGKEAVAKTKAESELMLQSEKVRTAGLESEAAKTRFTRAMVIANANATTVATLSGQLAGMVKGTECKDAMPVVNRVLEAVR